MAAYRHYMTCRAVGKFPDDPIVGRHAMFIRSVEDVVERERRIQFEHLIVELSLKK